MKLLSIHSLAALFAFIACSSSYQEDPQPTISEDFVCNSTGVDLVTNETFVEQFLAFDATNRRSNMEAFGDLVNGGMQEIKRCDFLPKTGWFSSSWGHLGLDAPSSWACTNTTISRVGELPSNCQYGSFWSFPENMKYLGYDEVNGVECEAWEWDVDGATFKFWASNLTIPVASAKVFSPDPNDSLWMYYYYNFIAGSPPLDSLENIDGVVCPDATKSRVDQSPPVLPQTYTEMMLTMAPTAEKKFSIKSRGRG